MHGPHGGIFVGGRPTKVDHEAITEVLRHIAVPGLQRRHRLLLVGPHHGAVVFGIEVLRESGRVDQVTEQHRELSTFGVGPGRSDWGRLALCWTSLRRGRQRHGRGGGRGAGRPPSPDEHAALFVHCQALAVNEFVLEVVERRVIELELALEGAVGQATPLAQEGHRLIHHRDKVHLATSLLGAEPPCTCVRSS